MDIYVIKSKEVRELTVIICLLYSGNTEILILFYRKDIIMIKYK